MIDSRLGVLGLVLAAIPFILLLALAVRRILDRPPELTIAPRVNRVNPTNLASTPDVTGVAMVSARKLQRDIDERKARLEARRMIVERKLKELAAKAYETMAPEQVLELSKTEERANIAAILGLSSDARCIELVAGLKRAGSRDSYESVVRDVSEKLGAPPLAEGLSLAEMERIAIGKALEKTLAEASPEKRRALLAEIGKGQGQGAAAIVTTTGALVLANLSGFGLYVAASTAVGALTSALGIVLPFAVYTGMSSVLATLIGPVGWAAVGLWALVKFLNPNYKKTIPSVLAIAAVRARLIAEREQRIAKIRHESEGILRTEAQELARLQEFMRSIEHLGPEASIPKNIIPPSR